MNNRQTRTLAMFHSVLDHLDRTKLEAPPPMLQKMRVRLEQLVQRVTALEHDQVHGRLEMSFVKVKHLKSEIRRVRMLPLVRVMRPQLKFAPGESAVWTVPHARADSATIGQH